MNQYLTSFQLPQLQKVHSGKVRDSFAIDDHTRMIVVTDRLSAFDQVLHTPIAHKGAVLNSLSNWWFTQTGDILPNHFIKSIDPNVTIVRQASPIRVEMVVRGYLAGSMWRAYQQNELSNWGISLPSGLSLNSPFEQPILTPTTKEKNDRPMSPQALVREGFVHPDEYAQMAEAALQLYKRGATYLAQKGIILVDTKYEFGIIDNQIVLIDEIHTPDSSRFWQADDYAAQPEQAKQMDKEFIRQWLLKNKTNGNIPLDLPDSITREASERYIAMYQTITERDFADLPIGSLPPDVRITQALQREGII